MEVGKVRKVNYKGGNVVKTEATAIIRSGKGRAFIRWLEINEGNPGLRSRMINL